MSVNNSKKLETIFTVGLALFVLFLKFLPLIIVLTLFGMLMGFWGIVIGLIVYFLFF